jgi:hypothetical protein
MSVGNAYSMKFAKRNLPRSISPGCLAVTASREIFDPLYTYMRFPFPCEARAGAGEWGTFVALSKCRAGKGLLKRQKWSNFFS